MYVRCIWTYRNLESLAYTRIEGKIWKCKGAPENNVFFEKGLNRHAEMFGGKTLHCVHPLVF